MSENNKGIFRNEEWLLWVAFGVGPLAFLLLFAIVMLISRPSAPAIGAPQAKVVEYCLRVNLWDAQQLTDCLAEYGLVIVEGDGR